MGRRQELGRLAIRVMEEPALLQIICRGYAEPLVLRIGYAYQAAHDWHLRVPPMAA
jgi:Asp-tRNA(Asn)/Glu-tRNA(Gln) amidotransferase A subunit family amidase